MFGSVELDSLNACTVNYVNIKVVTNPDGPSVWDWDSCYRRLLLLVCCKKNIQTFTLSNVYSNSKKREAQLYFPKVVCSSCFQSLCPNMWLTTTDLIYSALCSTENPVVKDPSWSCSRSCSQEVSAGRAQRTTSESPSKEANNLYQGQIPSHRPKTWKNICSSCSCLHNHFVAA